MNQKLKIVTTSDLFTKERKKGKQKIIVTQDLPDDVLHHAVEETKPTTVVKTSDIKDKDDEKEE